jgi:O-antigen ligase
MLFLLYILGLLFYYQNNSRLPQRLLLAGLSFNIIALLLTLSKTALAILGICLVLFLLFQLARPSRRTPVIHGLLGLGGIFLVGMGLFQWITGQSFLSMLDARMSDTFSYTWREHAWQDLLNHMDPRSLLLGNGFTASNAWLYQLSYTTDQTQPLILVHNGYVGLLYDMGLTGWLVFAGAFAMMIQEWCCWRHGKKKDMQPLMGVVMGMAGYFLTVSAVDEMVWMFNAPLLFWSLSTLLLTLEGADVSAQHGPVSVPSSHHSGIESV